MSGVGKLSQWSLQRDSLVSLASFWNRSEDVLVCKVRNWQLVCSCSTPVFKKNVLVCEICNPKSAAVGKRPPRRWRQGRRAYGDVQGTLPPLTTAARNAELKERQSLRPWLHLLLFCVPPFLTMTFIGKTLSCSSVLLKLVGWPKDCQIQKQKGETEWAGHIQCTWGFPKYPSLVFLFLSLFYVLKEKSTLRNFLAALTDPFWVFAGVKIPHPHYLLAWFAKRNNRKQLTSDGRSKGAFGICPPPWVVTWMLMGSAQVSLYLPCHKHGAPFSILFLAKIFRAVASKFLSLSCILNTLDL